MLGGPDHFVVPGFVNCHFHSESYLGRGLYEYVFERANIWSHGGAFPIDEEDLYHALTCQLAAAVRGGQTATLDMFYGRPPPPTARSTYSSPPRANSAARQNARPHSPLRGSCRRQVFLWGSQVPDRSPK